MALWRTEPAREGETSLKACLVPELSLPAVKRPNPCGRGHGRARPGGGGCGESPPPPGAALGPRAGGGRGAHRLSRTAAGGAGPPRRLHPEPLRVLYERAPSSLWHTGSGEITHKGGKKPNNQQPKNKVRSLSAWGGEAALSPPAGPRLWVGGQRPQPPPVPASGGKGGRRLLRRGGGGQPPPRPVLTL